MYQKFSFGNHKESKGIIVFEKVGNIIFCWYFDYAVYSILTYANEILMNCGKEAVRRAVENAIELPVKIDLVVVDNLMTALDVDMDKDEYRCQSKFVKKLSRLAKRHDVVVILIAHPRKNSFTKDENDAVSGSGDITNAADIVMTFKRDEDTEDYNYLSVSKNRWFGRLTIKDGIDLWYDQKSRRIIDKSKTNFYYKEGWEPAEAQQQNFNGFVDVSADDKNPFTM